MCSEIDARTRENPEAAMVQRPPYETYPQQRDGLGTGEVAHGIDGFDSAAHRAFMRSLG
jgi:hypothetical protein